MSPDRKPRAFARLSGKFRQRAAFPASLLHAFLLAFALCLSVPAPADAPEKNGVEIVRAEFGLFDTGDSPKETVFTEASVVPRREGRRYGWIIEVRTKKRSLSVREEYLLPPSAAPKTNENSGNIVFDIPMERRVQVSQRQLVPAGNQIVGEWSVGPGEPAGCRRLQVIIEDKLAADFEFDVE
jgi:hypothetical protein